MKITFDSKPIDQAPAEYTRYRRTEAKTSRFVREDGITTLELGVGKFADVTRRKYILICRELVQQAKKNKVAKLAMDFTQGPFPQLKDMPMEEIGRLMGENFEMANYEFIAFKTPDPEGPGLIEEIVMHGDLPQPFKDGVLKGQMIGEGVNACRTLANTPGGDMTPTGLAEAAKRAAEGLPVTVSVLGRAEMERLGMGAVIGVGKGSAEEPKFIICEYKGSEDRPIVLVGKGVTFDSGGLDIKTDNHMYEMHMDMSGGAAAITSLMLAAKLGLKRHVVALVPAVENMSASNAVRPGDILKSLSGKTIEVIDTDAEGRLILADALTYAKQFNPSVVLDTATLTGSSIAAVGMRAVAMLSNNDALAKTLEEVGEASGDYVWRLPLWEEYEENMRGTFADLVNIPEKSGARKGDVINAAIFLYQFAKDLDCPWGHLDIAPRMTAIEADKLAAGAAGSPVRLFVRFIEQWKS